MTYILLTYNRTADRVAVEPFTELESAAAELERATLAKRPTDEVVLFYTDSIETLRRTHSRYFFTEREMVDAALAGLGA